jgi:hypothetical protein
MGYSIHLTMKTTWIPQATPAYHKESHPAIDVPLQYRSESLMHKSRTLRLWLLPFDSDLTVPRFWRILSYRLYKASNFIESPV